MSRKTTPARAGSDRASLYDEITDKIVAELEATGPAQAATARGSQNVGSSASAALQVDRGVSGTVRSRGADTAPPAPLLRQ
jgi:antirestriction protein ArdC